MTMYADDTSITFAAKSVNDLNMTLNRELESLRKWLQGNKPGEGPGKNLTVAHHNINRRGHFRWVW